MSCITPITIHKLQRNKYRKSKRGALLSTFGYYESSRKTVNILYHLSHPTHGSNGKYDIIYLENLSLLSDFKVFILTILIIVQGRGK